MSHTKFQDLQLKMTWHTELGLREALKEGRILSKDYQEATRIQVEHGYPLHFHGNALFFKLIFYFYFFVHFTGRQVPYFLLRSQDTHSETESNRTTLSSYNKFPQIQLRRLPWKAFHNWAPESICALTGNIHAHKFDSNNFIMIKFNYHPYTGDSQQFILAEVSEFYIQLDIYTHVHECPRLPQINISKSYCILSPFHHFFLDSLSQLMTSPSIYLLKLSSLIYLDSSSFYI